MNSALSEKQTLRGIARTRRRDLAAAAGVEAAAAIRDQFARALMPAAGTYVAGYWPMADEADVRPLLDHLQSAGCRCLLPVMQGKESPLLFRAWAAGDRLTRNRFGIFEPGPAADAATPDLLLVPLLAFDDAGRRLGQGGGYYDRTLAERRAHAAGPPAVGIAFAGQQVDRVPHDGFDQRLDWVVTETGAIPFQDPRE